MNGPANSTLSSYQKLVIALLAFLQFTIVLDFMILSPLGAILMPDLKISPSQFGLVVSAYAFSAGASGLLAAGFADRFDRKRLLLFFYCGFVIGTLLCGTATSYEFLLGARIVTGLFGGVIGSISFAIVTDIFPFELRGRVMGVIQSAFAASQVLGIPFGLYLSNLWNWHAPFLLIVAVSTLVGVGMVFFLKPINEHLSLARPHSPFVHLFQTVSKGRYLQGFAATALLSTGGFMLMPFGSAFNVNNLGVRLSDLPLLYIVTGVFSMIFGPMAGRLSDKVGKFAVFCGGSFLTIVMVLLYTHLSVVPLWVVIAISTIMFLGVSTRIISSSALMSALPAPADRGAYMAVSSSLQQISGGIAAAVAGLIVVQEGNGPLQHFEVIGYVVVATTVISVILLNFINRFIQQKQAQKA